MKQIFITLGLIAAIVATVLSVLPYYDLAIFPAIAALIFGLIAFYLSKRAGYVHKIIQFTFLLTIMALSITIYKALFAKDEVTNINTEESIVKKEESKQEPIE